MTFLDTSIAGLDGTGANSATATLAPGGNYTFNPFATTGTFNASALVTDGNDAVSLRLIFADGTTPGADGTDDGMTLFQYLGGSFVKNPSNQWQGVGGSYVGVAQGSTIFSGPSGATTAQQVEGWLQTLVVIGWDFNDTFRITLRGITSGVTVSGSSFGFTYTIACFMQGTMIGTPAGERSVESLQAGDLVTTLDGSAKKVKWIGHRTYEAEFGASEAFVRPVLFRAGSLGGGLPTRDLKVSPQHGMLVDGVMVPAGALVNGVTILRDTTVADVTYFHVELDSHEAIFAEGAATETFVDHNSRAIFDNADEFGMLYGNATAEMPEIARLEEGFQLAAIRRTLADIAGIPAVAAAGALQGNLERLEDGMLTGWVIDSAGADAVEADVLVGGDVVARVVANRYRADLDQAGLGGGRGGFSVAVPASVDSLAKISLRRVAGGRVLAGPVLEVAAI